VTLGAAFANAFLCGFLLDSALTVADGTLEAFGSADGVGPLRNLVAWTVFWAAPLLALVALFSARLPRLPLLVLAAGTWWATLGAPPLGAWLAEAAARDVALGVAQAAFALPALRWIRRASGGGAWLLRAQFLPPASRASPRTVALVIAAVPVALGLGLVASAVYLAERATGGFVGFGLGGISFDERRYTRGDREVVLVGMSHLGRKGVYAELLEQPDDTPTVVLAEGVTDREGLLRGAWSLGPVAAELGLDSQPEADAMFEAEGDSLDGEEALVEIEAADVDLSTFRPTSVDFLRLAFRVAGRPEDTEARAELEALLARPDAAAIWSNFLDDVLDKRNAHLLERIDEALARRPRVVVPWGVLHLADVEAGLHARGFELASSEPRSFLPYAALLGIVTRMAAP
jgi:hypothetical protein